MGQVSAALNFHPVDLVIARLSERGCNPKASRPGQYTSKCPHAAGHKNGDKNPSLSIGTGADGKALLICQKGCALPDVARALDLTDKDLFPPKPQSTIGNGKRITSTYDYYDADGAFVFQVVRYSPKGFQQRVRADNGEWMWRTSHITTRPLYMLPQVRKAIDEGKRIWMCEGEKDAEALQWEVDGATTCNSGGAGKWREEYVDQLKGARRITLVQDADAKGLEHVKLFAGKLLSAGFGDVEVMAPPAPYKDVAEALGAGRMPDQFVHVWDNSEDTAWLVTQPPAEEVDESDDVEPELDDMADNDWESVSLAPIAQQIIDGVYQPTVPTILEVANSIPLFYRERINMLFGESGGGKTWLALAAIAETVATGQRVLFVDFEDNPNGIAERLVVLGVPMTAMSLIDYRNPTSSILNGLNTITETEHTYALIVVDSTGEAMAAAGVNSNDDGEVAQWFAIIKKLLRLPGKPAIIALDHVAKNQEGQQLFSIGSQRKRAAVTGASYRVDTLKEPAKGKDGRLKLTVAKDRPGNRPKNTIACHVDMKSADGALTITATHEQTNGEWLPTHLMERVSRWLEDHPAASTREVTTSVSGKQEVVKEALAALVRLGYVKVTPGARGAQIHDVALPYREPGEAPNQEPSPAAHRVPTASPPRPGRGQSPDDDLHTASHPLSGTQCAGRNEVEIAQIELIPDVELHTDGLGAPKVVADRVPGSAYTRGGVHYFINQLGLEEQADF